ncbi:hypothetical protein B0H15DRAFT_804534 [Mycena belliarum]|uniref:Uncharacterized protein n=1 Tax=Mycena belliarum TaxID=1033014 RepID=A0AAD6TU15_9AGAR|nr:hypothetical protein B0H15DRAFT_804534 [Mycena belliae]
MHPLIEELNIFTSVGLSNQLEEYFMLISNLSKLPESLSALSICISGLSPKKLLGNLLWGTRATCACTSAALPAFSFCGRMTLASLGAFPERLGRPRAVIAGPPISENFGAASSGRAQLPPDRAYGPLGCSDMGVMRSRRPGSKRCLAVHPLLQTDSIQRTQHPTSSAGAGDPRPAGPLCGVCFSSLAHFAIFGFVGAVGVQCANERSGRDRSQVRALALLLVSGSASPPPPSSRPRRLHTRAAVQPCAPLSSLLVVANWRQPHACKGLTAEGVEQIEAA